MNEPSSDPSVGESPAAQPFGQAEPPTDRPAARPRSRRREIAFALIGVVLFFAALETALQLLGFHFDPSPVLIDSTWGKPQIEAMNREMNNIFRQDDLLFWSLKPGARLPDGRVVNALGLLNGPIPSPKPPDAYRIVCLGDSCTAIGPNAYPDALREALDARSRPGRRFEVITAGVYTYTSHQGLLLLRHRLRDVQGDLVTVYYGWNDHYLTQGYPDKMLRSRTSPPPAAVQLLRRSGIYQLARRIVHTAQMQRLAEVREGQQLVRVAPEDYRRNLEEIVELARQRGARVILLTAPSNHRPGKVPAFFLQNRFARTEQSLIDLHRQYNEIVHEVARGKGVELLDLGAAFDRLNKDEVFLADGVHPNERGRRLIAEMLLKRLEEMGVLSPDG